MKNLRSISLVLLLLTGTAFAQPSVSLNVNLNSQPAWGPSGYNYAEYYYLPEMDAYYYVPEKQFVIANGNGWIFSSRPPAKYRTINLYRTYKVVINEPKPYLKHPVYFAKYKQYKNYHGRQSSIKMNRGKAKGHYKNRAVGNGNNGRKHEQKVGKKKRH